MHSKLLKVHIHCDRNCFFYQNTLKSLLQIQFPNSLYLYTRNPVAKRRNLSAVGVVDSVMIIHTSRTLSRFRRMLGRSWFYTWLVAVIVHRQFTCTHTLTHTHMCVFPQLTHMLVQQTGKKCVCVRACAGLRTHSGGCLLVYLGWLVMMHRWRLHTFVTKLKRMHSQVALLLAILFPTLFPIITSISLWTMLDTLHTPEERRWFLSALSSLVSVVCGI